MLILMIVGMLALAGVLATAVTVARDGYGARPILRNRTSRDASAGSWLTQ